jgi:hypothetical protein
MNNVARCQKKFIIKDFAYFSLIHENFTFEKLAFKQLILLNEGILF